MTPIRYKEFVLELLDHHRDGDTSTVKVRVLASAQGEQTARDAPVVTIPDYLEAQLRRLARHRLQPAEIESLGEDLGRFLFPPEILGLLRANARALGDGERLRVRLRIDDLALRRLPWEVVWLPLEGDPGGHSGKAGFLALDSRVSLVRHEVIGQPTSVVLRPGGLRRVLVVTADPDDPRYADLDLDRECRIIETALRSLDLEPEILRHATRETLRAALADEVDAFHFAGHGHGTTGTGFVVLEDEQRRPDLLSADDLADELRGCAVRLAVLGGCETGQRDHGNPWGGVTSALVNKAEIPAVVGMQFTVRDANAIAFVKKFYEVAARGEPVDAAVTAGRRVIKGDDRDWGAPVLYLRGEDAVLFPPTTHFEGLVRRSKEQTGRFLDDVRGADDNGLYRAELYVNRAEAEAKLWQFLDGEAVGLVLVGKAGCGKTNLLCHWTEELVAAGYPAFIYRCGSSIGSPIEAAVKRDLTPADPDPELRGQAVTLEEVVRRVVPAGRKLVLVFDGVNELHQLGIGPPEALREIDRIVGQLRGQGVRVVLSCSLPTWERLTWDDAMPLARGAYLWPSARGPLMLDDFTEDELRTALERYTGYFQLPTPLTEVSKVLRHRLRDPSLLRRFAQNYAGRVVREIATLRDTPLRIWEEYRSQQIRRSKDAELVDLLADEMLQRQQSALSESVLPSEAPPRLRELLTESGPGSACERLLDWGVLSRFRRAQDGTYWLMFTSTQFAAFVLARHLEQQREPVDEELTKLIHNARNFSLAWEVARILAQEQADLAQLARSTEPAERKLAAEALTDLHDNDAERALQLIDQLIQQRQIEARRTGLAAAAAIGRGAKAIFVHAATSPTKVLGREAAYALYLACLSDPDSIYQLLEGMATEITPRIGRTPWLPTPDSQQLIEFIAELSIAVYSNHCGRASFTGRTSALWEEIFTGQLRLQQLPRFMALRVMVPAVKRVLVRRMWYTAVASEQQNLGQFMRLPDEDKEHFRRAIALLEPTSNPRRYEDELAWLLESEVFVCNVLAGLALAVHCCHSFEDTKPLVRDLAQWLGGQGLLALLLSFTVLLDDTPDAWVELLEELTVSLVQRYPEILLGTSGLALAEFKATLLPLGLAYGKRGAGMPLLAGLLRDAAATPERLARLLEELAPIGLYYPAELFHTLRSAIPGLWNGRGIPDPVRDSLIESLGTIRALHFDKVDAFLSSVDPLLPLLPMAYDPKLVLTRRYMYSVGVYNNAVHMALCYPRSRRELLMAGMNALVRARRESSFRKQVAANFVRTLQAADYRMSRWTTRE